MKLAKYDTSVVYAAAVAPYFGTKITFKLAGVVTNCLAETILWRWTVMAICGIVYIIVYFMSISSLEIFFRMYRLHSYKISTCSLQMKQKIPKKIWT